MSVVMTTSKISKSAPFGSAVHSCVTYNNTIYISTQDAIYKYDHINNEYTLLLNKPSFDYVAYKVFTGCVLRDNIIYEGYVYTTQSPYNHDYSRYLRINTYNIDSNSYTNIRDTLVGDSYSYDYGTTDGKFSIFKDPSNNIVFVTYMLYDRFRWYKLDLNNNITSGENKEYTSCSIPIGFQYEDYFFLQAYYNDGYHLTRGSFGKLTSSYYTIMDSIGTIPTNLFDLINYMTPQTQTTTPYYAFGTFKTNFDNELMYYIVVDTQIWSFNPNGNIFTKLDITLPFSSRNGVAQVGNQVYIFNSSSIYVITFIEYKNVYNISNNSGDVIYKTLTGQSHINKLKFTTSTTGDIGYKFTTITGDVTGTYTPQIPSGYKLIGYSPSPNSTKAIIPLDTEITYNVLEDFTFYEVYGKYRPIDTPFSIKLYQNKAEANRVDKTNYITLVKDVLGVLRESTSIIDFSVVLELDTFPNFNYVYIEIFNRYYFVSDIVSVNKNIWEVSLSCDVLMSYKDAINACTGFVDRNENTYNLLIVDDKLPLKQGQTITTAFVNNTLFDDIQGTYVLQGLLVGQGDVVTPETQPTETTTKEDK
jgi:hypothetical protein